MAYYNPITTIASVGTVSTPIPITISSTAQPTTRPNGGALMQGDNWWDLANSKEYVWIVDPSGVGSWKLVSSGTSGGSGGGGGNPSPPNPSAGGETAASPDGISPTAQGNDGGMGYPYGSNTGGGGGGGGGAGSSTALGGRGGTGYVVVKYVGSQ